MVTDSLTHPTANWIQLDETFYRREERYRLMWKKISLDEVLLSVGSSSGFIAVARNNSKLTLVNSDSQVTDSINIYTSSGKKINTLKWDKGVLVSMGWVSGDQILLVFAEGIVRRYSIFGSMDQFSLGTDRDLIISAKFWRDGVVVCTQSFQFISVTGFTDPRPRKLAPPVIQDTIHCWDIIPPEKALSQHVEVYLSTGCTIMAIDSKGAEDQMLQQGPFSHIVTSPNGSFIALFTHNKHLLVVSVDFQQKLVECSVEVSSPPEQVAWCGNDLVLVVAGYELTAIGPFGDAETFFYDSNLFVATEIDGARVITDTMCEFIQKVPQVTQEIFGIGSTSSVALLYDALDHFEKKNPKADENVRIIGDALEEAVDGCISGSGLEWSAQLQKNLLKAASFGKCFLDNYNGDKFVRQCQRLRVLNALHHYEVGIPLTLVQFEELGINRVLQRLLEINQHLLALKICEYLNLPSDNVVIHWACAKIRASIDDEETTSRIILEKIGSRPGFSYHPIAKVAYNNGQLQLAIKLLDREPCADLQVPMLLEMGEDERALDKAAASGDTNLVYLAILHIKQKMNKGDFFTLINSRPVACNLLEVFCKQQDQELLQDFYYQDDRRLDLTLLKMRENFQAKSLVDFQNSWKEICKGFQMLKDRSLEYKMAEEQVKLLEIQVKLASKFGQEVVGNTLAETIKLATKAGDHTLASKLKSDFKVSDKRFWWLKLKGHIAANDWDGLEVFAKSKKSPIGYIPFFELCAAALQPREAMKYALRCEATIRPNLFLKIQAYREAGQQAFANKDKDMLKAIRTQCQDNEIRRELDVLLVQMNAN